MRPSRVLCLVLAVGLAGCTHRIASTPLPADRTAEIQSQLLRIEDDIVRANRSCDYAYFRSIEAEEFIFTDGNGGVTTRAEDLAGESQCRPSEFTQVIDEPRVIAWGNFAILNARNTDTRVRNGQTVTRRSRFTDVFVWRDGRWQLVSGQSTRIPEPRPGS
jgi:hypothetical protein